HPDRLTGFLEPRKRPRVSSPRGVQREDELEGAGEASEGRRVLLVDPREILRFLADGHDHRDRLAGGRRVRPDGRRDTQRGPGHRAPCARGRRAAAGIHWRTSTSPSTPSSRWLRSAMNSIAIPDRTTASALPATGERNPNSAASAKTNAIPRA